MFFFFVFFFFSFFFLLVVEGGGGGGGLWSYVHHTVDMKIFFFFFFSFFFFCWWWGGGLWSYVHHTVDMKILFLTLSVRLVVLLFFSVHAIFDDPVKVIYQEIDVIAHQCPLSILTWVVLCCLLLCNCYVVRSSVCLSVRLPVCLSICHFTSRVRSISPSPVKAFLQLPDTKMICRIYRYH